MSQLMIEEANTNIFEAERNLKAATRQLETVTKQLDEARSAKRKLLEDEAILLFQSLQENGEQTIINWEYRMAKLKYIVKFGLVDARKIFELAEVSSHPFFVYKLDAIKIKHLEFEIRILSGYILEWHKQSDVSDPLARLIKQNDRIVSLGKEVLSSGALNELKEMTRQSRIFYAKDKLESISGGKSASIPCLEVQKTIMEILTCMRENKLCYNDLGCTNFQLMEMCSEIYG